jgi:ketosteroid isomerase-like protein
MLVTKNPSAGHHADRVASPEEIERLVRRLYAAWPAGDRAALEEILDDSFHFTSPYDDAIDRATFFERCWPNHTRMKQFAFHRIIIEGNEAYVTYHLELDDGRHLENTELLRFRGDKLVSVDVYFGAEHDEHGRFVVMRRPT